MFDLSDVTHTQSGDNFEELGPLVGRRYVVDHGKRWANAAGALVVAVPFGWLGAWGVAAIGDSGAAGAYKAVGLLIGLALGALGVAVNQIVRAVRGVPGEYFEVREGGLVHGSRRGASGWAWDRVTSLHVDEGRTNALAARLGNGFRCVIGMDDGSRIRVDGMTRQAGHLGRTLMARCPDVALVPRVPWYARAGHWPLVGVAVCAAGVVAIVLYIIGHPDKEERITDASGNTGLSFQPGISDAGIAFLVGGLLVCVVVAVALVIAYVQGRAYRRVYGAPRV